MQSNKLMLSFILYISVFMIIVFIVGAIVTEYYRTIKRISEDASIVSDISIFDLYMLKTIKTEEIQIKKVGTVDDESSYYITFQKEDGTTTSFIKKGNLLYYNQIKICEDVDFFRVVVDKSEKESINVDIIISGKEYNLQYAII